jgi:hypothetical protein
VSRRRHRFAIVNIPVLDLRRRPDHRGELGSQLLLGEAVRLAAGAVRGGWVRVESLADGYRGWARDWGLLECDTKGLSEWLGRSRHRVSAPLALVSARERGGESLGPLPWMARVRVAERRGGRARVVLPDGRSGWTTGAALAPPRGRVMALRARVGSLLGVPYLWGGRTVLGLDCSGLTQLVMVEQGRPLPRDAHDQWRACRRVAGGAALAAGDLVFFSSTPRGRMEHVGILLGGGEYAHARGMVRLSSLEPSKPLFDKELARQLRGFGRPLRGRPGRGTELVGPPFGVDRG